MGKSTYLSDVCVKFRRIILRITTFAFYQMELKEKQRRILNVAVELFKEKGYMGSSVRDLATKLNIKAASLYAHIRSKEEILEWICFGIAQEFSMSFRK